ncbi:MAG: TolC family protein [Candidatus Solibacter sp.]|nr:TolC family protein [Candidatus Solibacter sp.]
MVNRAVFFSIALCFRLHAEIHPMTLREAVGRAVTQNPDMTLARLGEESARHGVQVAKDPFAPRVTVGSGLAYSNGFPMSIEGSAPSIVQAHATQFLFNRQQSYAVAQAKEQVRGAGFEVAGKRDEVAYRTASLYLDAERAARVVTLARKDAESLQNVLATIQALVKEGRALPLAEKQAALQVARARQLAAALEGDQANAETALGIAVGFSADDRVRPAAEQRSAPALPESEEQAVQAALEANKELRKLQSQIAAKGLEMRGEKASRLPRVDLVAQYGLFAKFNHYEDYFQKFQRHNGQIGMSFQVPVFAGPGIKAQMSQTETEISRLRVQLNSARNQISADLQQSFREVKKAGMAAEVARLDLEVAREQLSVNLAQMQEGRLTLRQVEEARVVENGKWMAFYDAQYAVEKARWSVLRLTGDLLPAIEGMP